MEVSADSLEQMALDYRRIEEAIEYLAENRQRQPSLREVADHLHLSEYHFQRLFTRWAGISPKRFLQYLTKEHAKRLLQQSESLLEAAYDGGLSGPGRLHDLFVNYEAVTPGEYKRRGEGLTIRYGIHPSPFGECLLAATERGVCSLLFLEAGGREEAVAQLAREWPQAELVEDEAGTRPLVDRLFAAPDEKGEPLSVFLEGTPFQLKVWEALLKIPSGSVVTYEDVAVHIGMPKAARAVGAAVGRNPIPVLIPCHRVIAKSGGLAGYRWGLLRKRAILARETAQTEYAEAAGIGRVASYGD